MGTELVLPEAVLQRAGYQPGSKPGTSRHPDGSSREFATAINVGRLRKPSSLRRRGIRFPFERERALGSASTSGSGLPGHQTDPRMAVMESSNLKVGTCARRRDWIDRKSTR